MPTPGWLEPEDTGEDDDFDWSRPEEDDEPDREDEPDGTPEFPWQVTTPKDLP